MDFIIHTAEMNGGNLTSKQIVKLSEAVASTDLEAIALEHLGIDEATIKNLRSDHRQDAQAFNRSILRKWMHRNRGTNQVQA